MNWKISSQYSVCPKLINELYLFAPITMRYSSGDLELENYDEYKVINTAETILGDIYNIGKVRVQARNTYTDQNTLQEKEDNAKILYIIIAVLSIFIIVVIIVFSVKNNKIKKSLGLTKEKKKEKTILDK